MDQFRRGYYPFYMGNVIGQFSSRADGPLEDDWHQFILVYYRERRNIFNMTDSQQYRDRSHHREAALARASLRFLTAWPQYIPDD